MEHYYMEKMHEARMRNLEKEVRRNFLLMQARGQRPGIVEHARERVGALTIVIRKRLKGGLTSSQIALSEKSDATV